MKTGDSFNLTNEHLTLLRHAVVTWDDCEFGAPAIDPKRPYGNSDVIGDMAELLGVPVHDDRRLHQETQTALQIVLLFGSFQPGTYERENGWSKWRRLVP